MHLVFKFMSGSSWVDPAAHGSWPMVVCRIADHVFMLLRTWYGEKGADGSSLLSVDFQRKEALWGRPPIIAWSTKSTTALQIPAKTKNVPHTTLRRTWACSSQRTASKDDWTGDATTKPRTPPSLWLSLFTPWWWSGFTASRFVFCVNAALEMCL